MLERGEVANSWRRERWDSLRLLTPNWQSRLPGYRYDGARSRRLHDDGRGRSTFISRFAVRAARAGAHAHDGHVRRRGSTTATTSRPTTATFAAAAWCSRAAPATCRTCRRFAQAVPASIAVRHRASTIAIRDQLPDGGVLVVGASATGVQLADEIHRSGRPVTLSVGEHVRLPRTYRGRDVLWWMDASGVWNQRYDEIDDLTRARRLPSPQLVGTPERTTLDLNALGAAGVETRRPAGRGARRPRAVLGRAAQSVRAGRSQDGAAARHVRRVGAQPARATPTSVRRSASSRPACRPRRGSSSTCASGEIRSIVWATGFRPDYSWLDVPVVDRKGHLRHDGGVVDAPGLYAIGLPVLRRRKSTFIHGAEDDARDVVDHLARYLAGTPARPARPYDAGDRGAAGVPRWNRSVSGRDVENAHEHGEVFADPLRQRLDGHLIAQDGAKRRHL